MLSADLSPLPSPPASAGDPFVGSTYAPPSSAASDSTPPDLNLQPNGSPLTYQYAITGPDAPVWVEADEAELTKLVKTLSCMHPTHTPATTPTYTKRVAKEKWDSRSLSRIPRIRYTVGGDRIKAGFDVGTNTAALPTVNALFHATVSEDALFATIDISDFYLGARLPSPQSIRLNLDHISPSVLDSLGITPFLKHDPKGRPYCFFDLTKTVPGLPQSGFHSQDELITVLNAHGYFETPTPMLFRHSSLPISFALVVDDFAVKYKTPSDLQHLISALTSKYKIKTHSDGPMFSYLGYTINYDRPNRLMTLSMPSYIPSLLHQRCPQGIRKFKSPAVYIPPSYGSSKPQVTPVSDSPPATPAEKLDIQRTVGSLLYYARALDPSFLPALGHISTQQASPTKATVAAALRLLGYAAFRPSATRCIRPSNMLLSVAVDASYLPRPNSGSVAGGAYFLGPIPLVDPASPNPDHCPNSPLFVFCAGIPVVVASAAEAEYAAIFASLQGGCELRTTLTSLGYPQPPTPVWCDNQCAVDLSNANVRPKKSKSIDMRFDWIRDRVRQGQFSVHKILGTANIADFFTKILSTQRHLFLLPFLLGHYPHLFRP